MIKICRCYHFAFILYNCFYGCLKGFVKTLQREFQEEPSLEVYVYNDTDEDWYLHHDYVLEVPALCLAAFTYDPGAENKTVSWCF